MLSTTYSVGTQQEAYTGTACSDNKRGMLDGALLAVHKVGLPDGRAQPVPGLAARVHLYMQQGTTPALGT